MDHDNHVAGRRRERRRYARILMGSVLVIVFGSLAGALLVPGFGAEVTPVISLLATYVGGAMALVGWYMKLGSDENKVEVEASR